MHLIVGASSRCRLLCAVQLSIWIFGSVEPFIDLCEPSPAGGGDACAAGYNSPCIPRVISAVLNLGEDLQTAAGRGLCRLFDLLHLLNSTAHHRLFFCFFYCPLAARSLLSLPPPSPGRSPGGEKKKHIPISTLTLISRNEFRPGPICHRGLRQIPEDFVHMDLFTKRPPRLPHDGEYLHRSHAALLLPGQLEPRSRESVLLPRDAQPELERLLGFLLLLLWRPAAGQPDRARPVWPGMGVQHGDLPEYSSHRGTV